VLVEFVNKRNVRRRIAAPRDIARSVSGKSGPPCYAEAVRVTVRCRKRVRGGFKPPGERKDEKQRRTDSRTTLAGDGPASHNYVQ